MPPTEEARREAERETAREAEREERRAESVLRIPPLPGNVGILMQILEMVSSSKGGNLILGVLSLVAWMGWQKLEERLTKMDEKIEEVRESLTAINSRIDALEKRLEDSVQIIQLERWSIDFQRANPELSVPSFLSSHTQNTRIHPVAAPTKKEEKKP